MKIIYNRSITRTSITLRINMINTSTSDRICTTHIGDMKYPRINFICVAGMIMSRLITFTCFNVEIIRIVLRLIKDQDMITCNMYISIIMYNHTRRIFRYLMLTTTINSYSRSSTRILRQIRFRIRRTIRLRYRDIIFLDLRVMRHILTLTIRLLIKMMRPIPICLSINLEYYRVLMYDRPSIVVHLYINLQVLRVMMT